MEVKANVNRRGKISQITPLHLEVSSSLIAKVQAEITFVTGRRDFICDVTIMCISNVLITKHSGCKEKSKI